MSIFDIANPANTKLLTSLVCPGGQGDVSVYKNLLFMSVEMPNGRLDCGVEGFPPEPPPPADEEKDKDKAKDDKDQNKDKDQDKDKDNEDDKRQRQRKRTESATFRWRKRTVSAV